MNSNTLPPSPPLSSRGEDSQNFKISGAKGSLAKPSDLSDEIILLAWIIVLLRTKDDGNAQFEWAVLDGTAEGEDWSANLMKFTMNDCISDLQVKVSAALSSIRDTLTKSISNEPVRKLSTSPLLLSTGPLSRASKGADEEGNIHLQVDHDATSISIKKIWHSDSSLDFTVERYIQSLAKSMQIIVSQPNLSIGECLTISKWDLDAIWTWNHELPTTYTFCMHGRISEVAQRLQEKVAIDSWDGCLTYAQVDEYSTRVAHRLCASGIRLHDVVPICFEKSRWTTVAVLAVMKAGATIALMDPTLPLARLQNMAVQVGAKAMVSSRPQHDLSTTILPDKEILVIEEASFEDPQVLDGLPHLPEVPASALMYIIFTSGSTGTPKGVQVSHSTYSSSAIPRAAAVGYTEESRVLDFASYAFDVSIDSMLLTLANGGCLCIPSDDDRLNDVNGAMRRMRITYAGITPSMARILDKEVIASLDALGLGGEAVSTGDCRKYGRLTRIVIGYGPCECTIGCTINSSAATGRNYISIGPGNGACMWIVDPNDHEILMPVGAVGELLVEGPIVGQGYLNDPEKTAATFIEDPNWLSSGHDGFAGRHGRLYKTGDLGKYDPDGSGSIVFVGRKDTQVKLRGQRVELGEVESQLRARLSSDVDVIAEVLKTGNQSSLVAFVAPQSKTAHSSATELALWQPPSDLERTLSTMSSGLADVLPRYMVPTVYIPVNIIPVLISSKTDRKRLRAFGTTLDLRKLEQRVVENTIDDRPVGAQQHNSRELSEVEDRLRLLWAQTIKIDQSTIQLDDSFFVLGGDSVMAMKLAAACKANKLSLTVAQIFQRPTLSAMAEIIKAVDSQPKFYDAFPFSMLSSEVEKARKEAADICAVEASAIDDIYPCTATQEGLFTFSLKSEELYLAQRVAHIPSDVDLEDWKHAWEEVVAAHPILRTRIVRLGDETTFQQIVLKTDIQWSSAGDLDSYLARDRSKRMDLGQPLARYAIIENPNDGSRAMVWSVHHILYDGWSEPLILGKVGQALQNVTIETGAPIRDFVGHLRTIDVKAQKEFWRQELAGATGPQFPSLPSRDYFPTPNDSAERQVHIKSVSGFPFTMATVIRAAWALVASQYTFSDDVVFGETLNGRDVDFSGVESVIGPLSATLPVRIQIDRQKKIQDYLQSIQTGMSARAPYQHMGFQYIRKVSRDAQFACEAPTGLVINAEAEGESIGCKLGFEELDILRENLYFNPYPLMLAFALRKDGFRMCASFDTNVVSIDQMERVLAQVEQTYKEILTGDILRFVADVSCLPPDELDQIWGRNAIAPLSLDPSSGRLRAGSDTRSGAQYPPAVVQWVCTPRNPNMLSPFGSVGEMWLESSCLTGETVENPNWLVAGSGSHLGRKGKLQSTGDLVRWTDDRNLVFVGRKDKTNDHISISPKLHSEIQDHDDHKDLTPAEQILRSAWAMLIGIEASGITTNDNFFRMGGDSIMAMKLVSMLRSQGHSLTVAEVFKHMRLGDAAKVMRLGEAPQGEERTSVYQPFSILGHADPDWLKANIVHPQLADSTWAIKDIFPVTDIQAMDVQGTIQKPRTSLQYTLLHFGAKVDEDRLRQACTKLVRDNDILRTVFVKRGSELVQVILDNIGPPISNIDVDAGIEDGVKQVCESDADDEFQLGSIFLKFLLLRDQTGEQCLVVRLSHAQYDGESLPRLLNDLQRLYEGETTGETEQFPRYVAQTCAPAPQQEASNYWRGLLDRSTLSTLPAQTATPEDKALFQSQPVDLSNRFEDITAANLLSAAWALVLARQLRTDDVTFGAVSSGRNLNDNLDLSNVAGPCYQIMPVRVRFDSGWTAIDLLRDVQTQTAQSSRHDFLGFKKIAAQCTSWPRNTNFFDSIIHHQNVIEEVDYMPFGDGQCRVDVVKPHGDAATPFKVVSYIRAGQTYVGVVGSEKDEDLINHLLEELVGAVQDLADRESTSLLFKTQRV